MHNYQSQNLLVLENAKVIVPHNEVFKNTNVTLFQYDVKFRNVKHWKIWLKTKSFWETYEKYLIGNQNRKMNF